MIATESAHGSGTYCQNGDLCCLTLTIPYLEFMNADYWDHLCSGNWLGQMILQKNWREQFRQLVIALVTMAAA